MEKLLEKSFEIGSIKVDVDNPFTWVSGYKMPIYNDNRMLMFYPEARKMVVDGFIEMIEKRAIEFDVVAGTATSGIPHATSLADRLGKPLTYIRTNKKEHGLNKTVEGVTSYKGQRVLLVEDLISTGKSSESALQIVREHDGVVTDCLSIFSYGFISNLSDCNIHSIIFYGDLYKHLFQEGVVSYEQLEELEAWHDNPFEWRSKQ